MNQPNARIIVIGGGANEGLIALLQERKPGAEVITLDEAQNRGLVPSEIFLPIERKTAMCFPEVVYDERKKKKSWEPVSFPRNKNKKRR